MADRTPLGTTARTGEEAPESGLWEIAEAPERTEPVTAGEVLPPHLGETVTWRLKDYS